MLILLEQSKSEPDFEFTLKGVVDGITLLGKPDLWFHGTHGEVLLDWKVNGYYSKYTISPKKGYTRIRPSNKQHKDAYVLNGINVTYSLDEVDVDWATQLSTYGWLCGAPVGGDFITAIDQLVFDTGGRLRVAEHRCRIANAFQLETFQQYKEMDEVIKSEWIFRELSEEDSHKEQASLDHVYKAYEGDDNATRFLKEMKGV